MFERYILATKYWLSRSMNLGNRMPDQIDNIDLEIVEGFGREWVAFDQALLPTKELDCRFEDYFSIFPFDALPPNAEGFDLGCGSGRWAAKVCERVGTLHCIDPSAAALDVARRRLGEQPAARFHVAGAHAIPLVDGSQDFGYSLGVLHHIPDTEAAMRDCVKKLKHGAPFLVYLYYNFDNRPVWFRTLWKGSDILRRVISRLPFEARKSLCGIIALTVYWPLMRIALMAELMGIDVTNFPLSFYRRYGLYTMRTDALDRFGTRLEHRFSRHEIKAMMERCGLVGVRFSDREPFWVACGTRR
jgi:SAM-dependent methyltransferase